MISQNLNYDLAYFGPNQGKTIIKTIDQWAGWKVWGTLSELIFRIVGTTGSPYNGDVAVE